MTLDPKILAEAQEVLRPYTLSAQKLIQDNLYGPREARLAGAIVKNAFTVVSYEAPTETEVSREMQYHAAKRVMALAKLLRQAMAVIEEHVAGQEALLRECDMELATAEEDYEDAAKAPGVHYVIVFPPLDLAGASHTTTAIDSLVKKLKGCGITTWVADERDQTKRLKAITVREIYNIGRVAAVVITNVDGLVLHGWYNGLPWVDEIIATIRSL